MTSGYIVSHLAKNVQGVVSLHLATDSFQRAMVAYCGGFL